MFQAFAPVIEQNHPGSIITKPMYESVSKGDINRVPLIIGMNSEEEISKIAGRYSSSICNKSFQLMKSVPY